MYNFSRRSNHFEGALMKDYQDTETGKIWSFDDHIDPQALNNRNIPKTLSETIIPKPDENHVWLNRGWIEKSKAPQEYTGPVSSVPSYNPAWISFLSPPYTIVLPKQHSTFHTPFEHTVSRHFDGEQLSKVVTTLPLEDGSGLSALVSLDGCIAIPRNQKHPSHETAISAFNRIFCAILLGGTHTEAIDLQRLVCGSLHSKDSIFINNPSLHSRIRHKHGSDDDMFNLVYPRTVKSEELKNSYSLGLSFLNKLDSFSPIFLLRGYSSSLYRNFVDALSNLWIVVEQLISILWENSFVLNPKFHPPSINGRTNSFRQDNRTWSMAVKLELLWQTNLLTTDTFTALSSARKARNDLAHAGKFPTTATIYSLWSAIFELFETSTQLSPLGMRNLKTYVETPTIKLTFDIHTPIKEGDFSIRGLTNFDEWSEISD
jgi:hypothetical protein